MANVTANISKKAMLDAWLATVDLRMILVKTGSTAEADIADADTISAIGTLNEVTVSGYARQALANEATALNDTDNRGELDADDVTFTALATGETVIGAIIYDHNTNDADAVPVAFLDLTDTPTNGGNIVVSLPSKLLYQT